VKAALLALLAFAPTPAPAPAQARPFGPDDLAALVRLSEPEISPDGRAIAFVVARPDYAANRYDTQLIVHDIATGGERVLVARRPGLGRPRWAPQGDAIACLASADGRPQVLVVRLASHEPQVVTRAPAGVHDFAWRPDGGAIAYIASDTARAPTGGRKGAVRGGKDG